MAMLSAVQKDGKTLVASEIYERSGSLIVALFGFLPPNYDVMSKRYLTAESVCAGHPDKLCDIIADSILEACLRKDRASRVACEVIATKGKIIVAGEISCGGKIDIRYIVRNVLKEIRRG